MQKLIGEHYPLFVFTLWVVTIPMIIKDAYGFVPSLAAAVFSAAIGFGIVAATTNKGNKIKAATLLLSVVLQIVLMLVFVERESPSSTSSGQIAEAE